MALSEFDRVLESGEVERYCPRCRTWKLKELHYNNSRRGGKNELCAPCKKQRTLEQQTEITKAACAQLVKQLVTGKAVEQIDVPHTSELASHVVKGFGGTEGLAALFVDAAKASYMANPTSKITLEWMKATKDLVVKSTDQRQTAPDVAQMNEEELNGELTAMIGKLLDSNPDLLAEIAQARIASLDEE